MLKQQKFAKINSKGISKHATSLNRNDSIITANLGNASLTNSGTVKKWGSNNQSSHWIPFKNFLDLALQAGGVWNLVDPNGAPAGGGETTFNETEPNVIALVNQAIADRVQRANDLRDSQTATITASGLSQVKKDGLLVNVVLDHQKECAQAENSRESLMKLNLDLRESYRGRLKEFEDKQAKCLSIFQNNFEATLLQSFNNQLRTRQFRAVYTAMCTRFGGVAVGSQQLVNLQAVLNTMIYSIDYTMEENLISLENVFTQITNINPQHLPDEVKLTHLRGFIDKSRAHGDIKLLFKIHPTKSFLEMKEELINQFAALSARLSQKNHNDTDHQSMFAHQNNKKRKFGDLSKGKKSGKRDISNITCYNCQKKGHYKSDCPDLKTGEPQDEGTGIQIDSAKGNPSDLASKFKNQNLKGRK